MEKPAPPASVAEEAAAGNSVGILKELCDQQKWEMPIYQLTDECFASNSREYRMTCTVQRIVMSGIGRTKQKAKHAAATEILRAFEERGIAVDGGPRRIFSRVSDSVSVKCVRNSGPKEMKNPITSLKEFCEKKKWEMPSYRELTDRNKDNAFYVEVTVVGRRVLGTGATSRLARKSAAFRLFSQFICEELKSVEINNNIPMSMSSRLEMYLQNHPPPSNESVEDSRTAYPRAAAASLRGGMPDGTTETYLYIIRILPSNPQLDEISITFRGYGILSTKYIPPVNPFPIFPRAGEMFINIIRHVRPLRLSRNTVEKLSMFHRFLFRDVLHLEAHPLTYDPDESQSGYLVVPVAHSQGQNEMILCDIDWTLVDEICRMGGKYQVTSVRKETREHYRFNVDNFSDAVVVPWYGKDPKSWNAFFVSGIMRSQCPISPFPEKKFQTFFRYFLEHHSVEIQNLNQPLLEAESVSAKHNFDVLVSQYMGSFGGEVLEAPVKARKETKHKVILVPELVEVHPVPASLWRVAMWLPAILHRLNSLQVAEELRRHIHESWYFKPLEFNRRFDSLQILRFGTGTVHLPPEPFREVRQSSSGLLPWLKKELVPWTRFGMYQASTGPPPSLVLSALTSMAAGDWINLERLEILGDAFLKWAISLELFLANPHTSEGILSQRRSHLVSNEHLFRLGQQNLNLGSKMVAFRFDARSTFIPPGYVSRNPGADSEGTEKHSLLTEQFVSNKSIADCVEAMIGCYLVTGGIPGALAFMSLIGLRTHHLQIEKGLDGGEERKYRDSRDSRQEEIPDEFLSHVYGRLEEKIGYRFQDKLHLVKAFSHPSCAAGTWENYERLEFLGDALLGYIVARYIYEDDDHWSPGEISDLRSALVNNSFFGALTVENNLHEFLHHKSNSLENSVSGFVQFLNKEGFAAFSDEYFRGAGEIEGVPVPKALGDVFESLAAAIYLDSGRSLDVVTAVYYRMMEPAIRLLPREIPRSPVRELSEMKFENGIKFSEPECLRSGEYKVLVTLSQIGTFTGHGYSSRTARWNAARVALRYVKEEGTCRRLCGKYAEDSY